MVNSAGKQMWLALAAHGSIDTTKYGKRYATSCLAHFIGKDAEGRED